MLYRLTKLKKLSATEFKCWWERLQTAHTKQDETKNCICVFFGKKKKASLKQDKFTWGVTLCRPINVNIKFSGLKQEV